MSKKIGKLLILHGSSSSGKTEIAKELLSIQEDYTHEHLHRFVNDSAKRYKKNTLNIIKHMELAATHNTFTESLFLPIKKDARYLWDQAIEKMKRNLIAKLRRGECIIFEGILQTHGTCENFFKALTHHHVILIKVHAPFESIEKKEQSRNNRINGWAKTHYFTMHKNKQYDFVVDTGKHSAKECAKQIKNWIDTCPQQ